MSRTTQLQMLVDMWPHPSGGHWTAGEIEEATNGEVHAGLWFAVKEGRTNPPLLKMKAALEAMDLPFALWFRPRWWWERTYALWKSGIDVGDRLYDQSYDSDPHRIGQLLVELGQLLVEWGYASPTFAQAEYAVSPWQLCTIEEASELLQVPEEEIEKMLAIGELDSSEGKEKWDRVNLRSVVRKAEPGV